MHWLNKANLVKIFRDLLFSPSALNVLSSNSMGHIGMIGVVA